MPGIAVLLAFAAGGCAVGAAWDLLAAAERARLARWLGEVAAPLRDAAREGREASAPERRRLLAVAAVTALGAGWLAAGPAGALVLGVAAPGTAAAALAARRTRYRAQLAGGAAGTARALADALSAGHSVRGAIEQAAREARGPAEAELRRAAAEIAVGEPTPAVLARLRRRCGGGPWNTLVAAVLIQREAGGDLAGLLREMAGALEAAARAEADARTATAQSRFTARLVAGLPALAAGVAEAASPGFLAGLLSHPASAALAAAAAVLQAGALVVIRRLARGGTRP